MSSSDALELLHRGAITIKGRMPSASNVTLLAELTREYPENPLFKKELSQLSVKLQSGKPQ